MSVIALGGYVMFEFSVRRRDISGMLDYVNVLYTGDTELFKAQCCSSYFSLDITWTMFKPQLYILALRLSCIALNKSSGTQIFVTDQIDTSNQILQSSILPTSDVSTQLDIPNLPFY